MLKFIINNWHFISVYLGCFTALYAILCTDDILLKLKLTSIFFILIHFFEEFGFPGGFPLMGMKVLMGSEEMDSSKWDCNNLSSMFGNWLFMLLVYITPVVFPNVRFFTLGVMLFNFAEILMHAVLFNAALKSCYNPGLITAVTGLGPVSIYYFLKVFEMKNFMWYDFVCAVVYFAIVFLFCFRSPLYWKLGRIEGYALTDSSAYGLDAPKKKD